MTTSTTTAVTLAGPGAEPTLGAATMPKRATGASRIAVSAAALNPVDALMASGQYPGPAVAFPFTPGAEGVGSVVESDRFAPGERVWFMGSATAATQAVADDDRIVSLEGIEVGDAAAAGIGIAGTTAWLTLTRRGGLRAGERVLVLGATGAVGSLATQLAGHHRAGRVVAAGRDAATLEQLRDLGADAVVTLRGQPELALEFRAMCPSAPTCSASCSRPHSPGVRRAGGSST